jgi:hypothetical protein
VSVQDLSPAELYTARLELCPDATVEEVVIWYMELHPDADEAQVRVQIVRRSQRHSR